MMTDLKRRTKELCERAHDYVKYGPLPGGATLIEDLTALVRDLDAKLDSEQKRANEATVWRDRLEKQCLVEAEVADDTERRYRKALGAIERLKHRWHMAGLVTLAELRALEVARDAAPLHDELREALEVARSEREAERMSERDISTVAQRAHAAEARADAAEQRLAEVEVKRNRHIEQAIANRAAAESALLERNEARRCLARVEIERDRYRERLQFDPGGSDKIDEQEECIAHLRHHLENCPRCAELRPWIAVYADRMVKYDSRLANGSDHRAARLWARISEKTQNWALGDDDE